MKTTKVNVGGIFLILVINLILSTFSNRVSADPLPFKVVVKRVIVPNGTATATMFGDSSLLPTVNIVQTNADKVVRISTALQFEFQNDAGVPVIVSNFRAARADFSLMYSDGVNGATIKRNQTPLGAYHPIGQGSPDYFVYNGNTDVTPTGLNKFVAGYLGDNSGTLIPSMTKFVLLDQSFRLGGDPLAVDFLPALDTAGQYYSLAYQFEFSCKYNGVTYSDQVISATATEVTLLVVSDIDKEYSSENADKPHGIRLEISDDLQTWVPAPVHLPHPRPTSPLNIVALVPDTTDIPEQSKDRRFYRCCRYLLP